MPADLSGGSAGTAAGPATGAAGVLTGSLWFAAGAAVIILTHLLRSAGSSALGRFGPLVPMCLGAYALVLGCEKMFSAVRRAATAPDPVLRRRGRRAALFCLLLILAAVAAGSAVWRIRAPYWSAIEDRNRGEMAAQRLRAIAERHAAAIQASSTGSAALQSWKETTSAALPLRPEFVAALKAARYLETSGGSLRAQAAIDARFYALCIEWMDLYDGVRRAFDEVSMTDPPPEWSEKLDAIIDRIQSLPRHPQSAS